MSRTHFSIPVRYVFTVMALMSLICAFMFRSCLSIAITKMVLEEEENSTLSWSQDYNEVKKFAWSEEVQGVILSSFFWGYIITHVPGGFLAEKFGGKYVLGIGILWPALLTLLTPLVVNDDPTYLIVLRFLEGFGEGVTFPALYTLIARWIPPQEKNILSTTIFLGGQFGTFLGNFVGGLILEYVSYGWSVIFYSVGIFGVTWFILWSFLCYDDPQSHPFISKKEKLYLQETIGSICRKKDLAPTPWKTLLTSQCVWVLVIANAGHDWGIYTVMIELPKYINDALKMSSIENGIMSGLPFISIIIASWISSAISDWLLSRNIVSLTVMRKTYMFICSVGPSVGMVCATYVESKTAVTLFLILGMAFLAFSFSSVRMNALDLSPNYAGSIMALVNGIGCLSGMLTPYITGLITTNRTVTEWRYIFWLMTAILVSTHFIFILFGSCHLQPWDNTLKQDTEKPESAKNVVNKC